MTATDTASRLAPYIEQLAENSYARENLQAGAESLRAAYERSQKRRVKPARDEKLRRQLRTAAASIAEGGKALASGRQKPKRRWPKRLALVLGVAAAVVLATNEELRGSLGLGGSSADETQGS
jgi:ferric-dicitrate binding protein FerR (iron transport regulator)